MGLPAAAHPWIAVAVTVTVFVILQVRRGVPTDLLFLTALLVVTLTGVISPQEALAGFANPAPIAIAGLLIVAAGLPHRRRVTGLDARSGHVVQTPDTVRIEHLPDT